MLRVSLYHVEQTKKQNYKWFKEEMRNNQAEIFMYQNGLEPSVRKLHFVKI